MNGACGKRVDAVTKARAIKQVQDGQSISTVASRQGISQSVLRNWLKDAGVMPPKPAPSVKPDKPKTLSPWHKRRDFDQ